MYDPLEFVPGYISPLSDEQHAQIGRIAILWGQIEHFIEHMLPHVTGLSWDELKALGVATKPVGSKSDFLKAAAKRLSDIEMRTIVEGFCGLIDETKTARNHVFHGIWGWRGNKRQRNVVPAARKTATPENPFNASELPALEQRLCRCSRMGSDIMMLLWQHPERVKFTRFIHHGDAELAPEWIQQWSDRNPLEDNLLVDAGKAGQLPRLVKPFSHK